MLDPTFDFRGPVVQIMDRTDPLRSDTTLLIAALLTLGIPQIVPGHCTYERVCGEVQWKTVWTLRDTSPGKRFSARELEPKWNDHAWLAANPGHPFAILRSALSYEAIGRVTPRFTVEELQRVETPDTWRECGIRNLIVLLRGLPRVVPGAIVRFGRTHAAIVPKPLVDSKRETRFLNYVEHPGKRSQLLPSLS